MFTIYCGENGMRKFARLKTVYKESEAFATKIGTRND